MTNRDPSLRPQRAFARILSLTLAAAFAAAAPARAQVPGPVPKPKSMTLGGGTLALGPTSRILVPNAALEPLAKALAQYVHLATGAVLATGIAAAGAAGDIELIPEAARPEGEYELRIAAKAEIRGRGIHELAYGAATLLQLLDGSASLPKGVIRDFPEQGFRGVLLDVARKYHSLETLKQFVDMCFLYKMPHIILHFSDDQGFHFPSTKYPKLATGSFYTLAQVRELEAYASARGVYIIPELEMPGHSSALQNAYPEIFKATGGFDIWSAAARAAVKDLMGELLDVFVSSPFIHLGGDESGQTGDPAYPGFIAELDDFAKSRGRTVILWEAPPGIPEDVWMILWHRGSNPVNRNFIHGSWVPFYVIDHYPFDLKFTYYSQRLIYGWDFKLACEPDFVTIPIAATARLKGTLLSWWEGRDWHAVPMNRERIPAMAAMAWNRQGETDFDDFQNRFAAADRLLERLLHPVSITAPNLINRHWKPAHQFADRPVTVTLSARLPGTIRYLAEQAHNAGGNQPFPALTEANSQAYTKPFTVAASTTVRAALFRDGKMQGSTHRIRFEKVAQDRTNATYGKPVIAGGDLFHEHPPTLAVDGVVTPNMHWLTSPTPGILTVDLQQVLRISSVRLYYHWSAASYAQYILEVSPDGNAWNRVAVRPTNEVETSAEGYLETFAEQEVRYVRVTNTANQNRVPDFHFTFQVEVRAYGPKSARPALMTYGGESLPTGTKPDLRWTKVAGAGKYFILLADNPAFTNAVRMEVADTALLQVGDFPGRLYWKVASDVNPEHFTPVDSVFGESPTAARGVPAPRAALRWTRTDGGLVFDAGGTDLGGARIILSDLRGRTAARFTVPGAPGGRTRWTWDGAGSDGRPLPPGLYFVTLQSPGFASGKVMLP